MIVGLGIDGVEVSRFAQWPSYSQSRLQKTFSLGEIAYALSIPIKAPERLAARFAAKEAAYKALSHLMPVKMSLSDFSKHVEVVHDPHGAPQLKVDLIELGLVARLRLLISLSHTNSMAMAVVIVEQV
jgi:holo-[acyl-carrier protein] synthase